MITVVDGHLRAKPSLNKLPLPLCPSFRHSSHVHRAWPAAMARRIFDLSDGDPVALQKLVDNYTTAIAHPSTLEAMKMWRPDAKHVKRIVCDLPKVACTLRYHPVFKRALHVAINRVPFPKTLKFSILPSWRNGLPAISSLVEAPKNRKT